MLKRIMLLLLVALVGVGCACAAGEVDYREIGRRIWVNESGKQLRSLVAWDKENNCALMGIGRQPWFSSRVSGAAEDIFPRLVAFAKAQGEAAPGMMQGAAPWAEAEEFASDDSGRKEQMHKWLAAHLSVQARFLVAQAYAAMPGMLRVSRKAKEVQAHFEELALTQQGLYCLADYLSFMGDGVEPGSVSGLLQVMEEMKPTPKTGAAPTEFARAAAAVLQLRAKSPSAPKGEAAKLSAWLHRCRTYSATAR